MDEIVFYKVVGLDALEGTIFCYCSTSEKATKAKELLEQNGFEYMVGIVQDEWIFDHVWIGDEDIEL